MKFHQFEALDLIHSGNLFIQFIILKPISTLAHQNVVFRSLR